MSIIQYYIADKMNKIKNNQRIYNSKNLKMRELLAIFLGTILFQPVLSWAPIRPASNTNKNCRLQSTAEETSGPVDSYEGSLHGNNSCFLPLKQLDQDYYAPRIVQVNYDVSRPSSISQVFLYHICILF